MFFLFRSCYIWVAIIEFSILFLIKFKPSLFSKSLLYIVDLALRISPTSENFLILLIVSDTLTNDHNTPPRKRHLPLIHDRYFVVIRQLTVVYTSRNARPGHVGIKVTSNVLRFHLSWCLSFLFCVLWLIVVAETPKNKTENSHNYIEKRLSHYFYIFILILN